MIITIKEINNVIEKVFNDTEVHHVDNVYEQIDNSDNLKLVIFFNKLLTDNHSIIYTKIIFVVDSEKTKLMKNEFIYLYDINCNYNIIKIENLNDFENELKDIVKDEKFGKNIKILSEFIKNPAASINEWFRKNNVDNLNITNVVYNPKTYITPCKSISFSFDITINNHNIEFIISKINNVTFNLSFKFYDDIINLEKSNLTTLIETIGDTLKINIT